MTLEEINNLVLENYKFQISQRLIGFVEWEYPVIGSDDEGSDIFDRSWEAAFKEGITKPSDTELEAEFLVFKQELIDAENARLAEIERVKKIKDRWNTMSDVRMAMERLNIKTPNMALELKRIIEENDETTLSNLEVEYAAHVAELTVKEKEKADKKAARNARIPNIEQAILDLKGDKKLRDAQLKQVLLYLLEE